MLLGHAMQQPDNFLRAPGIEVGERLVEQEQLRTTDEGVGNQDPLLFTTRERADPVVGEPLGTDIDECPLDCLALFLRPPAESEAVAVETECDEVPCPHRHVGVEQDLLRHIAE